MDEDEDEESESDYIYEEDDEYETDYGKNIEKNKAPNANSTITVTEG